MAIYGKGCRDVGIDARGDNFQGEEGVGEERSKLRSSRRGRGFTGGILWQNAEVKRSWRVAFVCQLTLGNYGLKRLVEQGVVFYFKPPATSQFPNQNDAMSKDFISAECVR